MGYIYTYIYIVVRPPTTTSTRTPGLGFHVLACSLSSSQPVQTPPSRPLTLSQDASSPPRLGPPREMQSSQRVGWDPRILQVVVLCNTPLSHRPIDPLPKGRRVFDLAVASRCSARRKAAAQGARRSAIVGVKASRLCPAGHGVDLPNRTNLAPNLALCLVSWTLFDLSPSLRQANTAKSSRDTCLSFAVCRLTFAV